DVCSSDLFRLENKNCVDILYVLLCCSSENSLFFCVICSFCFCHHLKVVTIKMMPITIKIILKIYGIQPAILVNTVVIKPGGSISAELDNNKAIARCIMPNKIVPEINKT